MHQTALKYKTEVSDGGRLKLKTPQENAKARFFRCTGVPRTTGAILAEASESAPERWGDPIDDVDKE